ncbi:MAG: tyrosine-type recombinase/integrase [Aggregatilineales bacterium]
MSNELVVLNNADLVPSGNSPLDGIVTAWLDEKIGLSGSAKTRSEYTATINDFRAYLQGQGADLDAPPGVITAAAQGFAKRPKPRIYKSGTVFQRKEVARSTANLRLSILSSFYKYVGKFTWDVRPKWYQGNPIDVVKRGKVQPYAGARSIDFDAVKAGLNAIDRSTLAGKRDYALLTLALGTGRRLSELAGLKVGDLAQAGRRITVTFRRTKGGEVMRNTPKQSVADALLDWLVGIYGKPDDTLADLPQDANVWVSLDRRTKRGTSLSKQAIADIWEKRLRTSKVHATRHTYAHAMLKADAPMPTIQAQLGHKSIATTGIYTARLTSDENQYADAAGDVLGF